MAILEEKRKFVRLNALVDVIYSKAPSLEKEKLSLSKNISKGGICLIAYEELKAQEMLKLKMLIPEAKEPISAVGRVAWVKEFVIGDIHEGRRFDVGIEFIEIKDEDANTVSKYVFSHLK